MLRARVLVVRAICLGKRAHILPMNICFRFDGDGAAAAREIGLKGFRKYQVPSSSEESEREGCLRVFEADLHYL